MIDMASIAVIVILLWTTNMVHIAPDKILDLETSGAILLPVEK